MSIAGRVYTVTGSSSGIGHALTLLLVENGAIVYGSDVNQKGLDVTKDECKGLPGRLETTVLDVRKDEAVKGWVKSCVEKEGKLDGSANVAGVSADKPASVGEIEQKDWAFVLDINLTGVMQCMRAQLPYLTVGGSIVNVSSTCGLLGQENIGPYCASKHGVIGLSKSASAEYGRKGIRINTVCPGPIDTPIFRNAEAQGIVSSATFSAGTQLGRMGKPREVAEVLMFLLSDRAAYVTGGISDRDLANEAAWTVDGGLTAS